MRRERIHVEHLGNATEINVRPFITYVDGVRLFSRTGKVRRFASENAAINAGRNALGKGKP